MRRLPFPTPGNLRSTVTRAGLAVALTTLGSLTGLVATAPSALASSSTNHEGSAGVAGGATFAKSAASATGSPLAQLGDSFILNSGGGYVAAGVAMRNLGSGTIHLTGIPSGSTIEGAYLLWDVIATSEASDLGTGNFNGHNITGTLIATGKSPCWGTQKVEFNHSFWATVTNDLTTGDYVVASSTYNRTYVLRGFASGTTSGKTPLDTTTSPFPELEGATLVVIYASSSAPPTTVELYGGAAETQLVTATHGSGNVLQQTINFPAGNSPSASTTFIVADGQSRTTNGVHTPLDWGGTFSGQKVVNGFTGDTHKTGPETSPARYNEHGFTKTSEIDETGNLWDTDTVNGSTLVHAAATSATATVEGGYDCLVWVGQVFSIATVPRTGHGGGGGGGGTPNPPPGPIVTVVWGPTADATAAAEFTRAFPYTKGSCPTSRAAVVATTAVYQDALSSQYLAQSLTTGTLLTPTLSLSPVTATALKEEGIKTVYITGGPLAVTTTVAGAIGQLPAYACGGTSPTGTISVQRIWGETQYGTAEQIADHVGISPAARKSFASAYSTANSLGGTGRYNDTSGAGSSAPSGAQLTAILASGQEFQDAQSASMISYHTKLPLLLTPATTLSTTAVAAIQELGITQLILMGGEFGITNTVESALIAKTGVSVLRVAGETYSDTARQLARFEAAASTSGLGWTPGHRILVSRGNGFTDGIAGAVLDGPHNTATGTGVRPLLLTENPIVLGTSLVTFLKNTGHTGIDGTPSKKVTNLTILGGPLAVSTTEISAMVTDLSH